MKYNIIDIIDKDINDEVLKVIINKKLYKIIDLMEHDVNYYQ